MSEFAKVEIFTFNGKLPKVREIKMPHKEASHFEANLRTVDGKRICKLDFGYGRSDDEANAEHLVKCWNRHDGLVAALETFVNYVESNNWEAEFADPMPAAKAALAKAEKS